MFALASSVKIFTRHIVELSYEPTGTLRRTAFRLVPLLFTENQMAVAEECSPADFIRQFNAVLCFSSYGRYI